MMAGAVPRSGVKADVVGVVVAPKSEGQAVDRDPIQLTRVAIRLLDLADQRAVHRRKTSIATWARARPPSGHAPRPVMTVVNALYTPTPAPAARRASWPDFTVDASSVHLSSPKES